MIQVYQSNLTSQSYIPPRPGLYSVVLGASDLANNTKYVRRLVLFDPVSHVTSDPDHDLFVSTASEAANYSYQSNISSDVVVTWEGHFRNAFVEDNGLLGELDALPSSSSGGSSCHYFAYSDSTIRRCASIIITGH